MWKNTKMYIFKINFFYRNEGSKEEIFNGEKCKMYFVAKANFFTDSLPEILTTLLLLEGIHRNFTLLLNVESLWTRDIIRK